MKLNDRLGSRIEAFNRSRVSPAKNRDIAARLEDNQQNLLKIIENVNGMRELFVTVAMEVRKVGDLGKALPNLTQVNRIVRSLAQWTPKIV